VDPIEPSKICLNLQKETFIYDHFDEIEVVVPVYLNKDVIKKFAKNQKRIWVSKGQGDEEYFSDV